MDAWADNMGDAGEVDSGDGMEESVKQWAASWEFGASTKGLAKSYEAQTKAFAKHEAARENARAKAVEFMAQLAEEAGAEEAEAS